jgi:hypothetical protein
MMPSLGVRAVRGRHDNPKAFNLKALVHRPRRFRSRHVNNLSKAAPQGSREDLMIANQKICVVLPAYNAGRTLETTYREISRDVVDDVILVDDASTDDTLAVAKKLGIFTIAHARNKGYGELILPSPSEASFSLQKEFANWWPGVKLA